MDRKFLPVRLFLFDECNLNSLTVVMEKQNQSILSCKNPHNPLFGLLFERPYLKQSQKLMYYGLWS